MSVVLDDENYLKGILKDNEWLHSNYRKLIEKYNNQYIAIKGQDIKANANTLDEFKTILKQNNLDFDMILVEHITDDKECR